ncbi:hypothetical protein ACFQ0Q_38585 [Streptomyces aureus]
MIAVRTPVASGDWDGVVVAVNSADQYVQCESKGDKGTSQAVPPTFINNRLWGTGRVIEYFDSFMANAGKGKYLMLGAGHYTSDVAKITISYGNDPKQYPAVMSGGAFTYAAALSLTHPRPALCRPGVLRPCLQRIRQGDLQPGEGSEVHQRAVSQPGQQPTAGTPVYQGRKDRVFALELGER